MKSSRKMLFIGQNAWKFRLALPVWSPHFHSMTVKTQHFVDTKVHLCAREASAHHLATPRGALHICVRHERASRQRGSSDSLTPDQTAFIRWDAKESLRISARSMHTLSITLMLPSQVFFLFRCFHECTASALLCINFPLSRFAFTLHLCNTGLNSCAAASCAQAGLRDSSMAAQTKVKNCWLNERVNEGTQMRCC